MMRSRHPLTILNPSLRSRCFTKSSLSSKSTPLTWEMFISPNHVKIAVARPTMFKFTANSKGVIKVPIPASVRKTATIPDGYSVDFILDPSTIIATLRKNNEIITLEQLPAEALKKFKDLVNAPTNIMIIPTPLHAQKRALDMISAERKSDFHGWLFHFISRVVK